jgi:prepilin-type N-terminal cleavage/methylation domain-containing protein
MKAQGAKTRSGCATSSSYRRAFTLIELLVVVAIILILAGISLKIMGVVGNKTALAKTDMVLEQVKNALAGYYAIYGSYPAVNDVSSTLPYIRPAGGNDANDPPKRGLTAFLLTGKDGSALTQQYCNPEATRWDHYLAGIYSSDTETNQAQGGMSMLDFTNKTYTITDGWDRKINYSAHAPDYQTYTLWSGGATSDTNDDIYVTFQ